MWLAGGWPSGLAAYLQWCMQCGLDSQRAITPRGELFGTRVFGFVVRQLLADYLVDLGEQICLEMLIAAWIHPYACLAT